LAKAIGVNKILQITALKGGAIETGRFSTVLSGFLSRVANLLKVGNLRTNSLCQEVKAS
jgi:hypothetical protein